jgi:hypothetical protein
MPWLLSGLGSLRELFGACLPRYTPGMFASRGGGQASKVCEKGYSASVELGIVTR